MKRSFCILTSILLLCAFTWNAQAAKRVALVIGNSAYEHATPLANPHNDAMDMAAKLEELGFEVVSGLDLDYQAMRKTVREFTGQLDGADLALFFYAGHGLQVNGQNYMAPIDANLASEFDLEFEAVPMDLVMSIMERATDVNLVFLDACRDNPLARNLARSMGTRSGSVGRGLAKLGSGVGSLIAFATQPGNVALDGEGRNSPFTKALLEHLGTPGQDVTRDLIRVRRAVLEQTDGKQVPWDNSSLTGEVILNPEAENEKAPTAPAANNNAQFEITFWNSIKDAESTAYFETYLQQFPQGRFAVLAKLKIAEMRARAEAQEAQRLAALEAEKQREVAAAKQRQEEEARQAEQKARQAEERRRQEEAQRLATLEAEKQRAEAEARRSEEAVARKAAQQRILAEAQQRAEEADELRNRQLAELQAAEQARKKLEERLLELEELRKQREQAAGSDENRKQADQREIEIASLPKDDSPAEIAEVPQIDPKKDREFVVSLQRELNRVGCTAGSADGIWGRKTERALASFGRHGQVTSLQLTEDLLDTLKAKQARVCPLVCGANQEISNGRCVNKQRQASVPNSQPAKQTPNNQPAQQTQPKATAPSGRVCYMCPAPGSGGVGSLTQRVCLRKGQTMASIGFNPMLRSRCRQI